MGHRDLFVLFLLACLGGGIFFAMQWGRIPEQPVEKQTANGPGQGDMAPLFTLTGLDGKMYRLEDFRGKIVFLNFWATWCPPCRDEVPDIEQLHWTLAGKNFQILAVSIDTKGAKAVAPFAENMGIAFPLLLDAENAVAASYGLTGVPETFLIDKNGVILSKIIGPRQWSSAEWRNRLQELSEKGP